MEQFRQIGEVLGSLKALMVFRSNIQINGHQCCLLLDMLSCAYEVVADEMKQNLRFEEKHAKWRILEQPLKELLRVFKEGEIYIRLCLDSKDWWAKTMILYQNTDCIDLHIHNLLSCMPVVIEAIEIAGEISGWDHDEMQKRRLVYSKKYQKEWKDPKLFQWKFGRQYLVTQDFCHRLEQVWKEDRWLLMNNIREKSISGSAIKYEQRLNDLLLRNLDLWEPSNWKLLPCSILVGSKDYQVRRRLGSGSQYKEILWLGETFALRHLFGNTETLVPEISLIHTLSHPNILHFLCSFLDEEKKECFVVTELMNRDLGSYIKEICGPRKRIPFSLPVAIDLMFQIARGMEYLHSKKIYHGDLNPSRVLLRARGSSGEGYLQAKVSGFGLSSCKNSSQKTPLSQDGIIWHSPEVLAENEETGSTRDTKHTEKSDVYSFGMICFELLTGKVPFEDAHLQGDKMSRNIRAGERPLFPFHSPKYLTNLTKRCWHIDPNQRPSFSSICRILRYVKRFLAMNPDCSSQPDQPMPSVDYHDIESRLLKKFPSWESPNQLPVSDVPFQMFAYRVAEREKSGACLKENNSESGSEGASVCGDEVTTSLDDPLPSAAETKLSLSPETSSKNLTSLKRLTDVKQNRQPGTPRGRSHRPPQITPTGRSIRMNSESQLLQMSPKMKRSSSGNSSD
ncbi:hypothetical protein EUGRSUZ_D02347 [Eucalyptus grandis]|uniref:Protein kinase domain-containing protein n=1 Tax=Eucalyptus grandis TaxID=71139 RepID=A0A059CIT3_EUCGR|nr:hypothetical protein EUGRSUZ_D02347 [Eucalyptus grandis]